jgi:glyoxylase-like metal-dependent hydrolase (beta-lactamase superfamily II)
MTETQTTRAVEILPDVFRVGGGGWDGAVPALSAEADSNVYLLRLDGAVVLVDCATRAGRHEIGENLDAIGQAPGALTDLLLTHSHWDHSDASAAWQAELPLLRTHLNRVGADFLRRSDHRLVGYQVNEPPNDFTPFRVDHAVEDGERFRLGHVAVTARFVPGHTPDSTIYTLEHRGLTIGIGGDVMFAPRPGRGAVLGQLCTLWLSDLDHYAESLRRLVDVPLDVLLPGHGDAIVGRDRVSDAAQTTLELARSLALDPRVRANAGV